MAEQAQAQESGQEFDHNVDRYPDFADVLAALQDAEDLPDGPLERVEITTLASGEATCRVWTPRAEEAIGMYLGVI